MATTFPGETELQEFVGELPPTGDDWKCPDGCGHPFNAHGIMRQNVAFEVTAWVLSCRRCPGGGLHVCTTHDADPNA